MTIKAASLANLTPFKPGRVQTGGRTTGSRDAINKRFLNALAKDFERFGHYSIARTRHKDPAAYVKIVAALQPKEIQLTRPLEGLNDDELAAIAEQLRSGLSAASLRSGDSGTESPETVN